MPKKKNTAKSQRPDSPQSDTSDLSNSQSEINTIILQELREFKQSFKTEIKEELKDNRTEIQKDMHKELELLVGKIEKVTKEVETIKLDIAGVSTKTNELQEKIVTLEERLRQNEQTTLFFENKYRERCIKLRNVAEENEEKLLEKIVPHLAKFIDAEEECVDTQIEKIFRINSRIAKEKKVPRDILISFTNVRIKEEIISQSYKEKLIIDDNIIEIYKDLPRYTLKKRQEYRFLTNWLLEKSIDYKWDKGEGIVVFHNQKRHLLNTVEKAKVFHKSLISEEKTKKNSEKSNNINEI